MANPLSSRGVSDRDYAAAVGTLMGEAAVRGNLQDYQAIADVIANRQASGQFGKSIAGITMNPREFSTWSPREKNAYRSAVQGFTAALNPARIDKMPKAAQERFSLATQALDDVFNTGKARGIAQGATFYDNPTVTAKLGTGGFHNGLEDQYGSIQIGAHRFSGPGLTDLPFDPVTYNGQLAAPPSADPFFGDLGAPPIGQVSFAGSLPDLTPAPEAGFSLPDLPEVSPDYSGITAGTAFDQFPGFSPAEQVSPDFSDMRQGLTEAQAIHNLGLDNQIPSANVEVRHGSDFYGDDIDAAALAQEMARREADFGIGVEVGHFPGFDPTPGMNYSAVNAYEADPNAAPWGDYSDITSGLYSNDILNGPTDFTGPGSYAPVGAFSSQPLGPGQTFDAPSLDDGFHSGFDEGPYGYTPDFSAPSLDTRNAWDRAQGSLQSAAAGMGYNSSDLNQDAIAARVNNELASRAPAPKSSAPQLSTPSIDTQSMYAGDWADKLGAPQLSTPSVSPQAPQAAASASTPARASSPPQGDWSLPDTAPLPPSRPSASIAAAPGAPAVDGPFSSITGPINNAISSVTDPLKSAFSSVTDPIKSGLHDVFGSKTDFLDAMANPQIAKDYSPGLFDGWYGNAIKGAAMGALTGGVPGAIAGGVWGGLNIGGNISNLLGSANGFNGFGGFFDAMANPYAGMSPQDLAAFAAGRERGTREPTGERTSGATRGDGSYSEMSGYNDNNPQGIL
jgi:hypothetical protein